MDSEVYHTGVYIACHFDRVQGKSWAVIRNTPDVFECAEKNAFQAESSTAGAKPKRMTCISLCQATDAANEQHARAGRRSRAQKL